ncbi:MAG: hypothetical protein JWO30_3554 [Fibrobacteres bacterium]|nr:hypothetical protein [Fibrobacterota bacterium]
MPQCRQPSVVSQKGSVLVAVLGLSIIMSMAAASLMLVGGNSRNDEDNTYRRMGCANDAESGLMMGVGWLRKKGVNFIGTNQGWLGSSQILFTNAAFENGSLVTVTVVDNAPAIAPSAPKTVISRAVHGSETVQYSWDVDAAGPLAVDGAPIVSLTNWRSP